MNERNDGGITCTEVMEKLDDFADGALAGEDLKRVQEHVAVCENCANFGAHYAAMLDVLKHLQPSQ